MKIIFLTGSHPRHSFIANTLFGNNLLSGLIIEERGEHVPIPPDNLNKNLKNLFTLHFTKRAESEKKFFGDAVFPQPKTLRISTEELNTDKVINFIKEIKPDLIISYGVHILSDKVINACKGEAWNIHGGLSPWYRGNITHFWPSYFLEPQMTGMTIHNLTQQLDAGEIIHQNSAQLVKGDGVHDIACRAVLGIAKELPLVIEKFKRDGALKKYTHKTSGKIWTSQDWRPEHLTLIYEFFDDKIVDYALEGKIRGRVPKLYRQFE